MFVMNIAMRYIYTPRLVGVEALDLEAQQNTRAA